MQTHAQTTHQLARSTAAPGSSRIRVSRAATRRLVDWWNDDTMSAHFSAERERDQRLLRPAGGRRA